jgi:hypothetical protein
MRCFVRIAIEKEHIYTVSNVPISKIKLSHCVFAAIEFFTLISQSNSRLLSQLNILYRLKNGKKWIWIYKLSLKLAFHSYLDIITSFDWFVQFIFLMRFIFKFSLVIVWIFQCVTKQDFNTWISLERSIACRNYCRSKIFIPMMNRMPSKTTTNSSDTDNK